MQILSNVLAFVLALGVIVFVHEAGHYVLAKAFGVRVLTFSLGFGRRLYAFRRGDTEYQVCWIPLGGYVSFAGQDPSEPSSDPRDYLSQARWRRVLILIAGPAMNVVLAVVLVTIVFASGYSLGDPSDLPPVLGAVAEGSPAQRAGLRPADRVLTVDGSTMDDWQDLAFAILTSPDRELHLEYERDGVRATTVLNPERSSRDQVGEAGIHPLVMIGEVVEGGAAEAAGFEVGDAVLSMDGEPIRTFSDLRDVVLGRLGGSLETDVLRGSTRLTLYVTPKMVNELPMIGVGPTVRRFTLSEAFLESVELNAELSVQVVVLIRKLIERRISLRASLGGPIEIAAVSGAAARQGFRDFFLIMAFISINVFILNLLPIPILDGGQILILLVESTLRRDLSLRLKERITQVGLVMIVVLMAVALYFDLSKNLPSVLSRGSQSGPEEIQPEN